MATISIKNVFPLSLKIGKNILRRSEDRKRIKQDVNAIEELFKDIESVLNDAVKSNQINPYLNYLYDALGKATADPLYSKAKEQLKYLQDCVQCIFLTNQNLEKYINNNYTKDDIHTDIANLKNVIKIFGEVFNNANINEAFNAHVESIEKKFKIHDCKVSVQAALQNPEASLQDIYPTLKELQTISPMEANPFILEYNKRFVKEALQNPEISLKDIYPILKELQRISPTEVEPLMVECKKRFVKEALQNPEISLQSMYSVLKVLREVSTKEEFKPFLVAYKLKLLQEQLKDPTASAQEIYSDLTKLYKVVVQNPENTLLQEQYVETLKGYQTLCSAVKNQKPIAPIATAEKIITPSQALYNAIAQKQTKPAILPKPNLAKPITTAESSATSSQAPSISSKNEIAIKPAKPIVPPKPDKVASQINEQRTPPKLPPKPINKSLESKQIIPAEVAVSFENISEAEASSNVFSEQQSTQQTTSLKHTQGALPKDITYTKF